MKIPDNVKLIHSILRHGNYECYLVGGCVRDFLLGENPHDYDLCTNALPETIVEVLKRNNISVTTVGFDYGTIVAHFENEEYEITTYRKETGYSDKRHPDKVEYGSSIIEDLKRRDFTMNAMAYNLDSKEIVDPYQGLFDLKNKTIKMVGNPVERIDEDPVRILRALRFAIKYHFQIEDRTKKAILNNKNLLDFVSKERITQEMEKMLTCGQPIERIFMEFPTVIFQIVPELEPCYKFEQKSKYHRHDVYEHLLNVVDLCETNSFEIKLAALLHDIGKPHVFIVDNDGRGHFYGHADVSYDISKAALTKDFRITARQYSFILQLIKEHDHEMPITRRTIRKFANEFEEDFIESWLVLKKADVQDHIYLKTEKLALKDKYDLMLKEYNNFLEEETRTTLKDLSVNGKDIMGLGVSEGKEIGIVLHSLLDMVLNDDVCNNKDDLLSAAKKIICKEDRDEISFDFE